MRQHIGTNDRDEELILITYTAGTRLEFAGEEIADFRIHKYADLIEFHEDVDTEVEKVLNERIHGASVQERMGDNSTKKEF